MKKNTLKISFYIILFSFIAKLLSFLARILLARNISVEAMSYYTILTPTIVILINCVQMGIPSILSKIVAKKGYTYMDVSTSICFSIFTTSLTSLIYILCIPFLTKLLFQQDLKILFYTIIPYLPFVSISGILKGYLNGRQKFKSSMFSQILEEITRIGFLLISFSYISNYNAVQMVKIAVYAMISGECMSSIYMLINIIIDRKKIIKPFHFSYTSFKNIINDAIPITSARFIGSFTYFLEPILMNLVCNKHFITNMQLMYGSMNGYVLPLLTMPSFLTNALSSFLLPSYSFYESRNNEKKANHLLFLILYFCLFVNCIYCLSLFVLSEEIVLYLYNTIAPAKLLKMCAIPFMVYSLQPILSNVLHAKDLSKQASIDTIVGCIIRLAIIVLFTNQFYEKTIPLAICSSMLITTFLHLIRTFTMKKRYN